MAIEAAVAIGSGISVQSLSLVAFGADSLIKLVSAGVLLWRLTIELRQGAKFPEAVERRASNAAGALLFALAAYVVASAAYGLWAREGEEFSGRGWPLCARVRPGERALSTGSATNSCPASTTHVRQRHVRDPEANARPRPRPGKILGWVRQGPPTGRERSCPGTGGVRTNTVAAEGDRSGGRSQRRGAQAFAESTGVG
jgi:hypothetical protein